MLSRITITEIRANINNKIFRVEAAFTKFSILVKNITETIKALVKRIEIWGVLNRRLTFLKIFGRRLSLLMAKGKRDAAKIPALAVEKNAKRAATAITILPICPEKLLAPSESGVKELLSSKGLLTPTVTVITKR